MITFFKPKDLDGILSTFTKTQKDLEDFISKQSKRQEDLKIEAEYIAEQQKSVVAESTRASKVLAKINEIVG